MVAKQNKRHGIAPGTEYGPFTVVRFTGERDEGRRRLYEVRCRCGQVYRRTPASLLCARTLEQQNCQQCLPSQASTPGRRSRREQVADFVLRTQSAVAAAKEFGITKSRVYQILQREGVVRKYERAAEPAPAGVPSEGGRATG